jgi:hypothetical protein
MLKDSRSSYVGYRWISLDCRSSRHHVLVHRHTLLKFVHVAQRGEKPRTPLYGSKKSGPFGTCAPNLKIDDLFTSKQHNIMLDYGLAKQRKH